MTKSELTHLIARRQTALSTDDIGAAIDLILDVLSDALKNSDRIEVRGFGVFTTRTHNPRMGRNPKTGEAVAIPIRRTIHFKPGKALKSNVNYD